MVPRYTVSPSETVNNYQTEKINGPGAPGPLPATGTLLGKACNMFDP